MTEQLSAEEILYNKCILSRTVVGTSMMPLLKEYRDTVVIERVNSPLKKYDVVLFRRGTQLVLHRIIKINNNFLIRGDNCAQNETVYENQIVGIMTHFTHKGRQYSVTDIGYRLYSIIWCKLFVLRLLMKKVKQLLKLVYRSYKRIYENFR